MNSAESKQRLLDLLPHVKLAIEEAKLRCPDGKIVIGIVASKPDGTGHLMATLEETEGFFDDLAEAFGAKDDPLWIPKDQVVLEEKVAKLRKGLQWIHNHTCMGNTDADLVEKLLRETK